MILAKYSRDTLHRFLNHCYEIASHTENRLERLNALTSAAHIQEELETRFGALRKRLTLHVGGKGRKQAPPD